MATPDYEVPAHQLAAVDGRLVEVRRNLDEIKRSFKFHAAKVDKTIAFVVLADNLVELLDSGRLNRLVVCETLALAVQDLIAHEDESLILHREAS